MNFFPFFFILISTMSVRPNYNRLIRLEFLNHFREAGQITLVENLQRHSYTVLKVFQIPSYLTFSIEEEQILESWYHEVGEKRVLENQEADLLVEWLAIWFEGLCLKVDQIWEDGFAMEEETWLQWAEHQHTIFSYIKPIIVY